MPGLVIVLWADRLATNHKTALLFPYGFVLLSALLNFSRYGK